MKCGIIVARRHEIIGSRDDYLPECILDRGHMGPHVFQTPEGKFIAWEDDWKCGCCRWDEDERCYTYWEILESDIPNLTKKQT